MLIIDSFRYSLKKALLYRANLISWIIADMSLYLATFLTYYLIIQSVNTIGDYHNNEILLFVSSFLLVNNIFAIFFSDAVSTFLENILNGKFYGIMLRPRHVILDSVLSNLNFPPLFTTPLLIAITVFCLNNTYSNFSLIYILLIICGALTMGLMFFLVFSLALRGIRVNLIAGIIFQIIQISERPDTVLPNRIRSFFVFVIPIYMFSAVPTRYVLGRATNYEIIWAFAVPIVLCLLLQFSIVQGFKKYKEGSQ